MPYPYVHLPYNEDEEPHPEESLYLVGTGFIEIANIVGLEITEEYYVEQLVFHPPTRILSFQYFVGNENFVCENYRVYEHYFDDLIEMYEDNFYDEGLKPINPEDRFPDIKTIKYTI
jgi:hypothetical protein